MKCIVLASHFIGKKEAKAPLRMNLEDIPGIGKATADQLLKAFRSVKNIKEKAWMSWQEWLERRRQGLAF